MSVIEVECPVCKSKRGFPCYFAEETRDTFRVYRYGTQHGPETRVGRHKGTTHHLRRKAATEHRGGRAKLGLPYTLEVDFETEKVKINLLVPNYIQGAEEVREEEEKARLTLPATKGEIQELNDRLDKIEETK